MSLDNIVTRNQSTSNTMHRPASNRARGPKTVVLRDTALPRNSGCETRSGEPSSYSRLQPANAVRYGRKNARSSSA
jgi:hypothetical protein